jgi:hypothetical protein
MNHKASLEREAWGYAGFSSRAAPKCSACLKQIWACGVMDGTINSTAAKKRGVRGIHYRVDVQLNYVAQDCGDSISHVLAFPMNSFECTISNFDAHLTKTLKPPQSPLQFCPANFRVGSSRSDDVRDHSRER